MVGCVCHTVPPSWLRAPRPSLPILLITTQGTPLQRLSLGPTPHRDCQRFPRTSRSSALLLGAPRLLSVLFRDEVINFPARTYKMFWLYGTMSPAALGTRPAEAKNPGGHQNDNMNHGSKNRGKEKSRSRWKDKYQCSHSHVESERMIQSNLCRKRKHSQISKSNLWIPKEKQGGRGKLGGSGLTCTCYYI